MLMSSWCDASIDVDEYAEWGQDEMRTARKVHRCCECDKEISVGHLYEHALLKNEGEITYYKTCLACKTIRERFCPDGWYYGGLDEQLQDSEMSTSLMAVKRLWYDQFKTISGLIQLAEELAAQLWQPKVEASQ